jgi:mycothione reductase
MRSIIRKDINMIEEGLSKTPNVDYYKATAEFVAPYTLRVSDQTIHSKLIARALEFLMVKH